MTREPHAQFKETGGRKTIIRVIGRKNFVLESSWDHIGVPHETVSFYIAQRPWLSSCLLQPFYTTELLSKLVRDCEEKLQFVFAPAKGEPIAPVRRAGLRVLGTLSETNFWKHVLGTLFRNTVWKYVLETLFRNTFWKACFETRSGIRFGTLFQTVSRLRRLYCDREILPKLCSN